METNNEAVEENPLTKSSRTLVQISSIYINLPAIPMQINEIGSCHHNFSIRGYTAEKRSNQNASVLFPSDGDYVEQLPPMDVPKFRWWRCSECSKEVDSASGNATMGLPGTQPSMVNTEAIAVDANTVEGASSLSSPQKTTNALSGDVADMGVINESSEQAKGAVANNRDEGINAVTGDVISSGHEQVSAPQMSTDAEDLSVPSELQKSAESSEHVTPSESTNIAAVEHRVDGFSGKLDASETDQCRENEHSTGIPRRKIKKVRLLTDLLGEKSSSKGVNPCPKSALFESADSRNAGSEVQIDPCKAVSNNLQSLLRKNKVTREEGESSPSNMGTNIRAPRRDNGKAILVGDVPDSEAEVNAFAGEGLFIGTKTERSRRRSDSTPALGRKKNKQSQVLDFATALPSLTGSLQLPSAAGSWGNCQSPGQTDQNHDDFMPGALETLPSDNTSAKAALDLSLDSFIKRIDSINQSSASKESAKKDGMPFGGSITVPAMESDASRKKVPLWDLNERATQKEMDFLQLGLHEKNTDVQGNLKQSDQRADDIPMEIVELLAKKQYERTNGDMGKISVAHVTDNTSRRFLEVEEIRTVEQFAKEFPNFPDFRSFNARNGISMPVNSMGAAKQTSINLSHVGRSHLNQPKSIYTAFAQSQLKLHGGVHIPATDSTRPVLQCSDAVEPLFLSSSSKMPFGLDIQHKLAAEQHKGKTISDIKADELRRSEEARLNFPKPGDSMGSTKGKGPLDPYANESIPAMQLLSLMDGRSPGAAINLGPSRILDKPFTPCSFHPRFSTRQDFLNGSFFSRQRHLEASGFRVAGLESYQSSRQLSAISSDQISFKPPEQEKSKEKSQKTVLDTGAGPSSSRGKDKQKARHPSDSILFPPKHYTLAGSRRFNLDGRGTYEGLRPVRSVSSEGECTMNQNPADFSIPEAGNIYTICARDLKFRKRNASREKRPSVKVNGVKRQRVTKAKPGNENAEDRSS